MKKAGARITIAENGQIAFDKAMHALKQGTPFDVILMDMSMPVMDGYQATAALRDAGYTGSIIALTANAMDSDMQKCLDAGCNAYETKPINRKSLIQAIQDASPKQKAA